MSSTLSFPIFILSAALFPSLFPLVSTAYPQILCTHATGRSHDFFFRYGNLSSSADAFGNKLTDILLTTLEVAVGRASLHSVDWFFNLLPEKATALSSRIRLDINFKREILKGADIIASIKEICSGQIDFCIRQSCGIACLASLSVV